MISDLKIAARSLSKSPAFATTAILTLALGVGATTAIFSVVNSILLNPAGLNRPESLMAIRVRYNNISHLANIGTSVPDYATARDAKDLFSSAATSQFGNLNYTGGARPERLLGLQVTAGWFATMGVEPRLGRDFRPEEDQPGANQVVILSHAAWSRLFGSDPAVVGRTITLNQKPHRVIGVMGPEQAFPARIEAWTPIAFEKEKFAASNRHNQSYFTIARLKPGITLERATAGMDRATEQVIRTEMEGRNPGAWGIFVKPLNEQVTGPMRTPLLVLLGAVGCVLLIACTNIGGLLLARAAGRGRDVAVRAALGAGPWQLVKQTLAESAVLSATGGLIGLALSVIFIRGLLLLAPEGMANGVSVRLDPMMLAFAFGLVSLAFLWFGLAPAFHLRRADQHETLKEGGRSNSAGRARQAARAVLVSAQVALALILLVGAGLFIRSMGELQKVDVGFQPRGVQSAFLSLPESQYPTPDTQSAFYRNVIAQLKAQPGVELAAAAIPIPFSGDNWSGSFGIEGRPVPQGQPSPHGDVRYVSPDYFKAMGIPLVRGRFFDEFDGVRAQPVIIVDTLLAKTYFPDEDALGKVILRGDKRLRIVGIVGHVRHSELGADTKGAYFLPMLQNPIGFSSLLVRGAGDLKPGIAAAVRSVDPNQPFYDLKTMDERVSDSLGNLRFAVRLLGVFAGFALLMAALGLYGLISYSVTQRTQEIGIRMALGADQGSVLGMVVVQGLRLLAAGVAVGAVGAYAVARLIATQLFGVQPYDPVTFGGMAVVLTAVAIGATYLPARRAARVDPMVALRYE